MSTTFNRTGLHRLTEPSKKAVAFLACLRRLQNVFDANKRAVRIVFASRNIMDVQNPTIAHTTDLQTNGVFFEDILGRLQAVHSGVPAHIVFLPARYFLLPFCHGPFYQNFERAWKTLPLQHCPWCLLRTPLHKKSSTSSSKAMRFPGLFTSWGFCTCSRYACQSGMQTHPVH